ncbi:PP2C family protein-serine/threonine phosphatase [Streptomyces sp. NPDC057638]|uniref:PP2C family protein-serine/threonine phosphatase n=1 Tax=Streptomyces sp. NPDC057638 TaxID=3346190 RepID=UPI00367B9758
MGQQQRGRSKARRFIRVLPALMIAAGVVFDLTAPAEYTGVPMLTAAPLIAAPFFGWRPTLAVGLVALFVVIRLHVLSDTVGAPQAYTETITVVTVSALALLINRVVRRGGQRLATAQVVAEAAQRAILPVPSGRVGGISVAARYEAALAEAFVGGDLFAVQDTPHGLRLLVGDVQGKGLGAVAEVAVAIGAFRVLADQEESLVTLASRLEEALSREAARLGTVRAGESFTTAVVGEIPPGGGRVVLVNRGHPEPLVIHPDGGVLRLDPAEPALPLGLSGLIGPGAGRADTYPLPPGSLLLLYTDGLTEARDSAGVFYDPEERLSGRYYTRPDDLLDFLVTDVRRHVGGPATDDMALLALRAPSETPE